MPCMHITSEQPPSLQKTWLRICVRRTPAVADGLSRALAFTQDLVHFILPPNYSFQYRPFSTPGVEFNS